MLKINDITTGYAKKQILNHVTLSVDENFVYLVVGPNGAGKSTLLKTIAGFLRPWEGSIHLQGKEITSLSPADRARQGIGYFFQGGAVFKNLTVQENLEMAGSFLNYENTENGIRSIYEIFPILQDYKTKRAGMLSGGERHQLALGMVFLRKPKVVLLDEPSAGLAPAIVKDVLAAIQKLRNTYPTTVILVEQNISEGMKIADYVCFIKAGKIVNETQAAKSVQLIDVEKLFFQ